MKKIERFIKEKINDCKNKTIVITGANSGIGYESMCVLAKKGANIIMACRSIERASKAREKLCKEYQKAQIEILEYDQSSKKSIKNFIINLTSKYKKIDGLILNAGIYHPKYGLKTNDGYPLTIGTNYLGLVYLIEHLKDYLKNTKIVFVSSIVYKNPKIKNYDFLVEEKYNAMKQYALSKCAVTNYFAYLCSHSDLQLYMMHPGVSSTNIFSSNTSSYRQWFKKLAKSVLPLFVHSPKKASLGMSLLIANDYGNHTFLGPRGIGQISGYPHIIKLRKNGYKYQDDLYTKTMQVLKDGDE